MNKGTPQGTIKQAVNNIIWDFGLSNADVAALLRAEAIVLETGPRR